MWVGQFYLHARFLDLGTCILGGIILHCRGCLLDASCIPLPTVVTKKSLYTLPDVTWGLKLPLNEKHGLKVNRDTLDLSCPRVSARTTGNIAHRSGAVAVII